ncbi:MAG: hypothetical protein JW807_07490 [Spirochaetes bacterium]|nr:hypothetical protein [Spirochaetota bacterium]
MNIEDDFNLHKIVIQSVETQIRDNDPPVTKAAFDRLLENGHDEASAKEMIASVIAEEIYLMLSENRKMNVESFAARLEELS